MSAQDRAEVPEARGKNPPPESENYPLNSLFCSSDRRSQSNHRILAKLKIFDGVLPSLQSRSSHSFLYSLHRLICLLPNSCLQQLVSRKIVVETDLDSVHWTVINLHLNYKSVDFISFPGPTWPHAFLDGTYAITKCRLPISTSAYLNVSRATDSNMGR